MSQPPDAPDPYLPSGGQEPSPPPPQGPYGAQPPAQEPYPPQPYPQQPGTGMPAYQAQGYGTAEPGYGGGRDPRSQAEVRRDKPQSVVRLLQAMVAGAVLTLLSSVYAVLTLEDAIAAVLPDLEQVAADFDTDTATLVDLTTTFGSIAIITGAIIGAGLWLLFAWLFGRGQARIVGTVLGGLNAAGTLFGLVDAVDAIDLALRLLTLAVVVAALVLLWLPSSSAWFRAVKVAGRPVPWG